AMSWSPATELFGPAALHEGTPILETKTLSDRRAAGGGVAYLLRATPPAGKLIKIVAIARSDEHVFNLEGGRANKAGKPVAAPAGKPLTRHRQPQTAMTASPNTSRVIYPGEPEEVTSVEVIAIEPAPGEVQ